MLAGLLFATRHADDRPDRLTATLPFAGGTLIEFQARQLVAAGAGQIVVLATHLTPELMGALNRIGRRGVAVDTVRDIGEAAEKLHPLSRVVMLADGLVSTDATVDAVAAEGGDALLVTALAEAPNSFERVGGGMAWAGIARLDPRRVADVAAMPRDYDPQSALLRVAEAAGAVHLMMPPALLADGHGIDHAAAGIERRAARIVAATIPVRRGWFDRRIVAPVARRLLPQLMARGVPGGMVAGIAGAFGLAGIVCIATGWARIGLLLCLIASIGLAIGAVFSVMRESASLDRAQTIGADMVPALAALVLAHGIDAGRGDATAGVVALGLIVVALLGERALVRRNPWSGSPPAYLLVLTVVALPGWALAGMAIAAGYATATLWDAIERLRRQP